MIKTRKYKSTVGDVLSKATLQVFLILGAKKKLLYLKKSRSDIAASECKQLCTSFLKFWVPKKIIKKINKKTLKNLASQQVSASDLAYCP